MYFEKLLFRITKMSREILQDNLVGIYLHGSAALGCFNPEKSDLDLILVVEKEVPDAEKLVFMQKIVALNQDAPAKGIELSIVKKEVCDPFVYPTPFELHFSETHLNWFQENPEDYIQKMKGTDKDLAAHFTIINHCGIALYGASVGEVFEEVPVKDYIDSIWFDIENAQEEILENPMYMTLNLCRVLAYLQENLILSKKNGGEWGLSRMPEKFHSLILEALQCYESEKEMAADPEIAVEFAGDMIRKVVQLRRNRGL